MANDEYFAILRCRVRNPIPLGFPRSVAGASRRLRAEASNAVEYFPSSMKDPRLTFVLKRSIIIIRAVPFLHVKSTLSINLDMLHRDRFCWACCSNRALFADCVRFVRRTDDLCHGGCFFYSKKWTESDENDVYTNMPGVLLVSSTLLDAIGVNTKDELIVFNGEVWVCGSSVNRPKFFSESLASDLLFSSLADNHLVWVAWYHFSQRSSRSRSWRVLVCYHA